MASARELYARLPNSIRKEVAFRRARRWLRATAYARWHNDRVGPDAPRLNFYPMRPEPRMQVAWLLLSLRMRIGFEIRDREPTMAWDTGTLFDRHASELLPEDAINGRCLDASKSHVDALWARVAGYSVAVDPSATSELIVVKPEENGAHGGRLVRGPLKQRAGFVYQRLVDTRFDGRVHSTRPFIVGRSMPVVFEFVRAGRNWFHGVNQCRVATPGDVYSGREIEQILAFAAAIGLEFGELDVFRDRHSGLLYVLDANRTSFRPAHISGIAFRRARRALIPAMRELVASRSQ